MEKNEEINIEELNSPEEIKENEVDYTLQYKKLMENMIMLS